MISLCNIFRLFGFNPDLPIIVVKESGDLAERGKTK